jgi:hypothetical protein
MEPVPINRFESGTSSINQFQKKTGLPALVKFEVFLGNRFQNCFFNKTGSKMEPVPINRFEN